MNNTLENVIHEKIVQAFSPQFIALDNESHMHNVPKNSETHFKLTLVSEAFNGVRLVQRHQRIYALLQDQFQSGLHALALHVYTPEEWASKGQSSPASPQCMGGSKAETSSAGGAN